ncbi:uncharacterized protein SRS1_11259 [Sporisorium reilianum f. sp. reilianum]|uniref:Uncharacterized protein n=1 Tax=Sporisorium reilianum f. sp. reilianum TaxID=72559 RepID=A0A2N8UNW2_9BASI|nr:uncharacterized protein SRS1_11259 [Sporisorium reilianum f. sp. reilianum]
MDSVPATTEAPAEPVAAVSEQVAASSTEPASQVPVQEAKAGADSTAPLLPTQSGPEAASASTSDDASAVPVPSTADPVSTEAPTDSVAAASANEEATTDPAIAGGSASAPQGSATSADPSPAAAQDVTSSVAKASSATALTGASNDEQVQPVQPSSTSTTEQPETTATAQPATDTVPPTTEVPPQPSAAATEPASTTAQESTSQSAVENANAPAEPSQQPQTDATTQSSDAAPTSSTDAAVAAEKSDVGKESVASISDQQSESTAPANDAASQPSSSSSTVPAPPAVQSVAASEAATASAPATPERKTTTDGASAAQSSSSVPTTPVREGRVALILRINKELIRVCVDMQAKELTTDPVYREAALRLQANLGYLASIADQAGKSVDPSSRSPPKGALPRLEPFPRSEHAPSSPLPALFDRLIAFFGAAGGTRSPSADGKKRSRDSTADLGGDDARKRAASKGIERSLSASSNQLQAGANAPSDVAQHADASAPMPSTTEPTSMSTPSGQPIQQQQQQPTSALQGAQQQPQQPGKGPDLSLAPPVPIAPPAAAQNIPNNPQAQALMQAFGPNALVNLHALQSHLRGQGTHPWVAFMEANVVGFKSMPLQMQLQQMTSLQNAALQRQKAMQGSTGSVGSPAAMQQPQQMMANGGVGGVSSPAAGRPVSRHSDSPGQALASPSASTFGGSNVPGRTGTPLGGQGGFPARPGSSGSVGSMTSAGGGGGGGRNRTGSSNLAFDPSQLQSAPSPATMASMAEFAGQQQQQQPNFGFQPPGLQQGSPTAVGSPAQQQQQQQQLAQPGMGMGVGGMPNFQNLPPHLQQQIRQQYMAHMQAQAQARGANAQQQFFQSPQ